MLTLSMIVKNEENYLEDCLNSVKDLVDEIVIVDTGSTDRTIDIAKKHGAKIFNFKWIDDFSAARNYALDNSSGDWILYLDADERLSPQSKDELLSLTSEKNKTAYYCKVNSINETNNQPAIMDYVRLFSRDESVKFEGKIHEQIENSLRKAGYAIKQSAIEIIHVGYNITEEKLKLKAERNLNLLLNEYEKQPTSYYAYQIGQTYGKLSNKENAEKYFNIALKDVNLNNAYKSIAYRYIALNLAEKGDWENAYHFIIESIAADSTQPVALLGAAKISMHLGKGEDAKYYCKRAYLMNEEYLTGQRSSQQSILVDSNTILREGVLIAATLSDRELFNFFYEELLKQNSNKPGMDNFIKEELLHKLFDNLPIEHSQAETYGNSIQSENEANVVAGLLDYYSDDEIKLILLNILYKKFPDNTGILNKLALILEKYENFEDAEKLLEKSYSIDNHDPSVVFYLISAHIKTGKFEQIPTIISQAEATFKNEQQILEKIELMKNKLIQIIS